MAQSLAPGVQNTAVLNAENLFCELKTVANWYQLGIQLGLKAHELHAIEQDFQQKDRRMLAMFDLLLRSRPSLAWGDVVRALQQVGENVLAENIRKKGIGGGSKL